MGYRHRTGTPLLRPLNCAGQIAFYHQLEQGQIAYLFNSIQQGKEFSFPNGLVSTWPEDSPHNIFSRVLDCNVNPRSTGIP